VNEHHEKGLEIQDLDSADQGTEDPTRRPTFPTYSAADPLIDVLHQLKKALTSGHKPVYKVDPHVRLEQPEESPHRTIAVELKKDMFFLLLSDSVSHTNTA
jgi:hypothetical protein